jgi:hypothetical protein
MEVVLEAVGERGMPIEASGKGTIRFGHFISDFWSLIGVIWSFFSFFCYLLLFFVICPSNKKSHTPFSKQLPLKQNLLPVCPSYI